MYIFASIIMFVLYFISWFIGMNYYVIRQTFMSCGFYIIEKLDSFVTYIEKIIEKFQKEMKT